MSVPVTWNETYNRCRLALLQQNIALTAINTMPGIKEPILFQAELRDKGKVKLVPDLLKLARDLDVIDQQEVPAGEWAAMREAMNEGH